MKILVVGTGAMACLFAARLAGAGINMTMLGNWTEGVRALKTGGVRLLDLDGKEHCYPIQIIEKPDGEVQFSHVIVLVKSWQTSRAALQLEKCLESSGIVLTLQNGLGNYEILANILGSERVALGVTTIAARLLDPGYVQHTGDGKVTLGIHPKLDKLGDVLAEAGFYIESVIDPRSLLWGKLLINAAINPLTAILKIPNGELLTQADTRELLSEVATETEFIAYHLSIRLPYQNPIDEVEKVARNTATNHSSMLQDVLNGRPTEIDAINGAIVHEGEKAGVPTPVNRVLWQLVRALDNKSWRSSSGGR